MSEIPKAYEPQSVEDKWYDAWLKQGCFTADPARVSDKRPAYSIVIPPPNVTGMLHMGHVLNNTIQDILARKARMDGKEVLWLPGTDHAGIATEGMVARQIWKEEKKSKRDIGREEFIKRVWQWKEKHGGIIIEQLKKLGCSCDWTRERFTMDPDYVRNVQRVFVDLYKKGLIYRGKRMVNWCPATQTALSDEEVEMKPQKGFMYHFEVQVVEEPATILTIATTRPETIPADTAVAVNPRDPRYAHLIGKHVYRALPLDVPKEQRIIPIIADDYVDFEFGTGVLKVTPAHDKNDFDIGQRHKLPVIDVLTPDAKMMAEAGVDLAGLDRFVARKKAAEILEAAGALDKAEPYENNVGFSQRADVPIEPRLSEQWFLKYPAVEQSKACVEQEDESVGRASSRAESPNDQGSSPGASPHREMRFHPQRWAKTYDHWLTNIQDWCISRQLWWGHRIPVWRHQYLKADLRRNPRLGEPFWPVEQVSWLVENQQFRSSIPDNGYELNEKEAPTHEGGKYWWRVAAEDQDSIEIEAVTESDHAAEFLVKEGFTQDPDVLDTWFSSWLWPFATMGWPEQTDTLKKFYPTTDLVTGPDIIFFWIARMIMAGYEYMGELPFKNVYFTGIIRDKQGRKMSKTLGNSPDPLVLIAQYGADALRFGTMRSAPLGQDVLFDEKDVELGRNFCNKLWNACRFRQMQGGSDASSPQNSKSDGGVATTSRDEGVAATYEVQGEINPSLLTNDDKWILLKLHQAIKEITTSLAEYKFNEATATLYRFFWSEYCDWYVEATKAVLSRPAPEASPSPLKGERAGVRGENESNQSDASHKVETPPHPDPLPPAAQGGEGTASGPSTNSPGPAQSAQKPPPHVVGYDAARRANTLAVIDFVLSHTLRLFHPFLPFITEELWHGMGYAQDMPENQGGKTIMNAPWPKPFDGDFRDHYALDDCYLEFAQAKYDLVTEGRNLRRIGNIPGGKKVKFIFKPVNPVRPHDAEVIRILLNAEAFELVEDYQPKKGTPTAHTPMGDLFLPLEGLVDVEAEKARLKKELEKVVAEIAKVEQKLANPAFTSKAPPQVLQEHQQRLTEWQAKKQKLEDALKDLEV